MKPEELAQKVLDEVWAQLTCDYSLYGIKLDEVTTELDVIRGVSRQKALEHFMKYRIPAIAATFGLKRPGEPEKPETKRQLTLVVNNK